MWHVRRGSTRLRCVASLTDGAAGGTSRGETAASVLHGVDVAVVLARMLLPGVPMGRTDTTGWRGPLVKARPCKVKGLDRVVKCHRFRRDGGTWVAMPPERRTGPHTCGVVWWHVRRGGTRLRGVAPLTDGDDTVVDVLRKQCGVNIIKYSERDKIMSFLHDVGTCAIGPMVIFHNFS